MAKMSQRARAAPSSSKSFTTQSNLPQRRRSADVLTPLVPPLYPAAPRPSPLNRNAVDKVNSYKKFCQHVGNNYGVHVPRPRNTYAFNVHRYTDRYNNMFATNPDFVPRIGIDRLPEELANPTKCIRRGAKVRPKIVKKSLDDLPDEDDDENQKEEDGEPPSPKKARPAAEQNPMNEGIDEVLN